VLGVSDRHSLEGFEGESPDSFEVVF